MRETNMNMKRLIMLLLSLSFFMCKGKNDARTLVNYTSEKITEQEAIDTVITNNYEQIDKKELLVINQIESFIKDKELSNVEFYINNKGKIYMLSIKYISIDLVLDCILKLSDLETLMLKTNSIKAIPDLSLLGKLKELIIHSNNLPVSLVVPGYFRELELLSIYSYRKTEEFICPDNLKLQRLVLYMNNIKKLHPSIYNLDSLEYLDLSNNQLSSIDLKRFKKLKKVIIAHNPIDDISSIKKKYNNIEVIF